MASTSRAPAAQTVVPDEIWEEIFLRLDATADLARTSAACSSFRRVVSERRFLRRFRSLRTPAVLGFIGRDRHEFVPVDPPHSSAPEARALQQAADFTFSFLPDPSSWRFHHARDGRVLLTRHIIKSQFKDLLVCDPLHRRYARIPPIPTDLMASTPRTGTMHLLPVLVPAGQNDEEESFRVICTVLFEDKAVAFVFSSCNQTWRVIISTVYLPDIDDGYIFPEDKPYYAHGCLYWLFFRNVYSLMLDTSEMEFSIIDLPPHNFDSMRAIVEAEEGRLRFLTIANGQWVDGKTDLYCKKWQNNGVGAQELQHDKLIRLPEEPGITYCWEIEDITGHYLALLAYRSDGSWPNSEYFVLDIRTLRVEKLCNCNSNNDFFCGFPYASFPPPLALPSI